MLKLVGLSSQLPLHLLKPGRFSPDARFDLVEACKNNVVVACSRIAMMLQVHACLNIEILRLLAHHNVRFTTIASELTTQVLVIEGS